MVPVDLDGDAPTRAAFPKKVLGKWTTSVIAYWNQKELLRQQRSSVALPRASSSPFVSFSWVARRAPKMSDRA